MFCHPTHSSVLLNAQADTQMAEISGAARGCPGGMSSPLAASQTFGTKHRARLRTGRQRHLREVRLQQPVARTSLSTKISSCSEQGDGDFVGGTVNKPTFTWQREDSAGFSLAPVLRLSRDSVLVP